jgi:repressor LexA
MLNSQELSYRQRRLYQYITSYQTREGRPPTYAEMQTAVGISSKSLVRYHLDVLIRQGLLDRAPAVARGVRPAPATGGRTVRVPVRGRLEGGMALPLAAGEAAGDEVSEALELTRAIAPDRADLYALRVRGNGLLDVLLNDGDIVVMRPAANAEDGELVAVRLCARDAFVLKRWQAAGKRVRLYSDDPRVAPTYVESNQVEVQGAVVAVIRQV